MIKFVTKALLVSLFLLTILFFNLTDINAEGHNTIYLQNKCPAKVFVVINGDNYFKSEFIDGFTKNKAFPKLKPQFEFKIPDTLKNIKVTIYPEYGGTVKTFEKTIENKTSCYTVKTEETGTLSNPILEKSFVLKKNW